MTDKNVTRKSSANKRIRAQKSRAQKSGVRKPDVRKPSVRKPSVRKPGVRKSDTKSLDVSFPAPPFSRFEGMVISSILVCVAVSYALAYFSPIPDVQHSWQDQGSQDYDSQEYELSYAEPSRRELEPRENALGADSLGVDSWSPDTTPKATKARLRPMARDKKGLFSTEKPLLSDTDLPESGLAETLSGRTPTALIGEAYDLAALRTGNDNVPRRFLEHFPVALTEIESASQRKEEFFKIMLPLVLKVNETILEDRNRLLAFRDQTGQSSTIQKYGGDPSTTSGQQWVHDLASRYGSKNSQDNLDIEALLKRVDTIPVSLALAQAAIESAWGSSRFAQEGNAPFGQWSFDPKGGLKPLDRDADKKHFVRRFSRLIDAVRSYAHNLNTHAAYREFRSKRAQLRHQKGYFGGLDLVGGLKRYSQRGRSYVQDVRRLIKANHLVAYDSVKLVPEHLSRAKNNTWIIATE